PQLDRQRKPAEPWAPRCHRQPARPPPSAAPYRQGRRPAAETPWTHASEVITGGAPGGTSGSTLRAADARLWRPFTGAQAPLDPCGDTRVVACQSQRRVAALPGRAAGRYCSLALHTLAPVSSTSLL